jgi:hypothetical protein
LNRFRNVFKLIGHCPGDCVRSKSACVSYLEDAAIDLEDLSVFNQETLVRKVFESGTKLHSFFKMIPISVVGTGLFLLHIISVSNT